MTLKGEGGVSLSRPKLFADCLVLCLRSAISAARKKHGLPHSVDSADLIPDSATDPIKYTDAELNIVRAHLRCGIIFAIQGSYMFQGKMYKKWSSLRPALQAHVMSSYKEAWHGVNHYQLFYSLLICSLHISGPSL